MQHVGLTCWIRLPGPFIFLKLCQIVVCKLKSVLVRINFIHHDASIAGYKGYRPPITDNLITLNHKPKGLKFVLPCLVDVSEIYMK